MSARGGAERGDGWAWQPPLIPLDGSLCTVAPSDGALDCGVPGRARPAAAVSAMARRATAALLLLAAAALVASGRAQDGGSTTGSVPTTGDAASPAADVDFASIKSPERKVDALAWDTAYTPTDEGLEPGASAATPDGKAYGTSGVSYADSRFGTGYWDAAKPSGKLLFDIPGQGTYMCSATLIGKSLLLTAAHCVFNYGTNATSGFFINWRFYPQQTGSSTPYGYWLGSAALVATSYYAGTDTCMTGAEGVVCNNDLALIWLQATGSTIAKQARKQGRVGEMGGARAGAGWADPCALALPTTARARQPGPTPPHTPYTHLFFLRPAMRWATLGTAGTATRSRRPRRRARPRPPPCLAPSPTSRSPSWAIQPRSTRPPPCRSPTRPASSTRPTRRPPARSCAS